MGGAFGRPARNREEIEEKVDLVPTRGRSKRGRTQKHANERKRVEAQRIPKGT